MPPRRRSATFLADTSVGGRWQGRCGARRGNGLGARWTVKSADFCLVNKQMSLVNESIMRFNNAEVALQLSKSFVFAVWRLPRARRALEDRATVVHSQREQRI